MNKTIICSLLTLSFVNLQIDASQSSGIVMPQADADGFVTIQGGVKGNIPMTLEKDVAMSILQRRAKEAADKFWDRVDKTEYQGWLSLNQNNLAQLHVNPYFINYFDKYSFRWNGGSKIQLEAAYSFPSMGEFDLSLFPMPESPIERVTELCCSSDTGGFRNFNWSKIASLFPNLKKLNLFRVKGEGGQQIVNMNGLERLNIYDCEGIFQSFPMLPDLETFQFKKSFRERLDFEFLSKTPNLKTLDLTNSWWDEAEWATMPTLPTLNTLILDESVSIYMNDISEKFPNLEKISWIRSGNHGYETNISKSVINALDEFAECPNLKELDLSYCVRFHWHPVEDDFIEKLTKLTQLKTLKLLGANLGSEIEQRLKAALPGCNIIFYESQLYAKG